MSKDIKKFPELEKTEDYFPYIGHRIGEKDPMDLRGLVMADYDFTKKQASPNAYENGKAVFKRVLVDIPQELRDIEADERAVNIIVPRHRSLFDFAVFQPVHHDLLRENMMIMAGDNLFIWKMNQALRCHGAFMFLRDDAVLSYPGMPKVGLNKNRYFSEVLPAYLKDQTFPQDGSGKAKHDLMVYLEYEKDAKTGHNNGGRTKTGCLRQINWTMIKLVADMAKESGVKTYVTPVNCAFSKVPDAPYLCHPNAKKGLAKNIRYIREQLFVYADYPRLAAHNREAALESVVRYGKPEEINLESFDSLRDYKRYAERLERNIGMLETVYPLYLIYKAMEQDSEIGFKALYDRMFSIYGKLKEKGASFRDVEDSRGNLLKLDEILEPAVTLMNLNPSFHIKGVKRDAFLKIKNNTLYSSDFKLQLWYANNILHLDKE
jgi:hypothetical protein